MAQDDQTLILLKPNITINDEVDAALSFFQKIGIVKKNITVRKAMDFFQKFYAGASIPNIRSHAAFCSSAPVVVVILSGTNIVEKAKKIIGDVDASNAPVSSVRGYFFQKYHNSDGYRNFVHASDSAKDAEREIKMFFGNK